MARPFTVLAVGTNLDLLKTRSMLLKKQGYVVASVDNVATTLALLSHSDFRFDLLILSHTIRYVERNQVAELCRELNPSARILVLVPHRDCDPLADACVDAQDGPQAFLDKVASLLKKGVQRAKGTASEEKRSQQ